MIVCISLDRSRPRRAETEEAAHDDVGGQEEEDHGLEDVHHLDGDAGLDLHQARAGTHGPEQQSGEEDARPGGPAEQGDRDRVEADAGRVGRRACGRLTPRISVAPARPASRPAIDIVRMMSDPRPHARIPRGVRVRADRPDLEAERAADRGATSGSAPRRRRRGDRYGPSRPAITGRAGADDRRRSGRSRRLSPRSGPEAAHATIWMAM